MKLPVDLERLAEQDLEEHVDYIVAERPSAAVRFIDDAEAVLAQENPLLEFMEFLL